MDEARIKAEEQGAQARLDALADENALLRASLADMRSRLDELEQGTERDPRTGLPNRQRFLAELDRVVGLCARHGEPAALLHIDVNGLKTINEDHGRMAGDAALAHVARLLSRLIRSTDVLGRMRGDEFGLILDRLDHDSAIETAERLELCIAQNPLDLGAARITIAAKIGVAMILPGDTTRDVLRRAGQNLSRAKTDG